MREIIDSVAMEISIMNHATPAFLLLLCIAFILWAIPRALVLAVALTGELVMFLFECSTGLLQRAARNSSAMERNLSAS